MITEAKINYFISSWNGAAEKSWYDEAHIELMDYYPNGTIPTSIKKELNSLGRINPDDVSGDYLMLRFIVGKHIAISIYDVFINDRTWHMEVDGDEYTHGHYYNLESFIEEAIIPSYYDNYIVEASKEDETCAVCTDTENMVVCKWEVFEFNETQKFTPIDDAALITRYGMQLASKLAEITKDMTDYLFHNFRDLLIPMSQRELIGYRIFQLRNGAKMTVRELAEECGLSANTISSIENGKFSARIDIINQILDVFGKELTINGID